MEPTAGGALEEIVNLISNPDFEIVARLAKGPTTLLDSEIALADLVECDFPGYAPIRMLADLTDTIDDPTYGEASPQSLQWPVGAIVTPQPIVAIYYTSRHNGGEWDLVQIVPFDEPFSAYYANQVIAFEASLVAFKTS